MCEILSVFFFTIVAEKWIAGAVENRLTSTRMSVSHSVCIVKHKIKMKNGHISMQHCTVQYTHDCIRCRMSQMLYS